MSEPRLKKMVEPPLKRIIHYLFRLCKWEQYDEHVRWCTGCGILQLNANYPLRTEKTEWMMFPLTDEEMKQYFETPEEERYLSDALFAYLRRMEELGFKAA
uniref:Uncharacterized protein n=1 Tax=viral metagenome TaxID=1070528 RepID=A0A6M3LXG3_9ZZZZ